MQVYSNKIIGTASVSITSSYEKLTERITTRVMALKIMKQKENQGSFCGREKSFVKFANGKPLTAKVRQPSKFLLGASIPNSIIKSEAQNSNANKEVDDKDTARAKRDASVREIIKRLESRLLFSSTEIIAKGVEEVANENNSDEYPKNLSEKSVSKTTITQTSNQKIDLWDAIKQQQRIRRRTSLLAPIRCQRRSTYEAIKMAIENTTNTVQEIVDGDCFQNRQLRKLELKNSPSKNSSNILSSSVAVENSPPFTLDPFPKLNSMYKVSSRASKMSKQSTTSSISSRKAKFQNQSRKSILKQGYRVDSKPLRSVFIVETNKEDSQTQTYLKMKDFV